MPNTPRRKKASLPRLSRVQVYVPTDAHARVRGLAKLLDVSISEIYQRALSKLTSKRSMRSLIAIGGAA